MNYPLKIGQPRFLTKDEVLTLHETSLAMFGGAPGFLNEGAVDSALAMPKSGFGGEYAHDFPFGMAAAYGYHLAMGHGFRDGNKRVAFGAMVAFLRLNGWNFEMADENAAGLMLELIEEHRDKAWLAERLGCVSRPRPSMELRDFFLGLHYEQMQSALQSVLAGRTEERYATYGEVRNAFPAIREALELASSEIAAGNQNAAMRHSECAVQLMLLVRLAEDLGYEW